MPNHNPNALNLVKCEKLGRKTKGVPEGYVAFRLELHTPEYDAAKQQVSKSFFTLPYIPDEALREEAKKTFHKTYKHAATIIVPQEKATDLERFFDENKVPVADFSAFMRAHGGLLHSIDDQPASKTFDIDVVADKHYEIIEYCCLGILHRNPESGPAYIVKTNRVISSYAYFQVCPNAKTGKPFSKSVKPDDKMVAAMNQRIAQERAAVAVRG